MTSRTHPLRLIVVLALLLATLGFAGPTATADTNEGSTPDRVDSERLIAAGDLHTCAILGTGGVQCWGSNDNGQLGNGTTTTSTVPVIASGVSAAIGITAGTSHTCALLHGGSARCWGLNGNGQLGNGSTADSQTPVPVSGLTGATSIAAGGFHTCVVTGDGTVGCWGQDGMGQLGDDSPGDTSLVPTPVAGITSANPATALALGEFHTCALLTDGTVTCWGHNGFGQLGDGSTTDRDVPTPVAGLPDATIHPAVALTAGAGSTCALVDDGTVHCWGQNSYGQLGHKTPVDGDGVMTPSTSPLAVQIDTDPDPLTESAEDLKTADALSAGQFHVCALLTAGTVRCWGQNGRGQLGADPKPLTSEYEDSSFALAVGGLGAMAAAVTSGGYHSCALIGSALQCWGYNFHGQLGGFKSSSTSPVTVTAIRGASVVTAGTAYGCALITDATPDRAVCWGSNADGRLGAGLDVTNTTVRVPVVGLGTLASIDAGNGQTCALPGLEDTPSCWGLGTTGQLGNGASASSTSPVLAVNLSTATSLSSGGAATGGSPSESGHTCARRGDSTAVCWGANGHGQLGDGSTTNSASPVAVLYDSDPDPILVTLTDLKGVGMTNAGGRHTCALMDDGTARCWGANGNGQVGDNTTTDRHTAVKVQIDTDPDVDAPLTNVAAIAAGAFHTCALINGGTVKCWGANESGQLGDGTTSDRRVPVAVSGLTGVLLLTAGDFHTCATKSDGSLVCWGRNSDGQLGNGSTSNSTIPVITFPAPGVPEAKPFVTSISASRTNTCARLIDGTISCWGDNASGQLGDGLGQMSIVPVAVGSLPALATNHIPDPHDDAASTAPNTSVTIPVLSNDTDPDSDPLTIADVSLPANGTAAPNGLGGILYTPTPGYCGNDTFTYAVSDGTAVVPATVVVSMNCGPIAANDSVTTPEDTLVVVSPLANDTDPDSDPLTVETVDDPAHGTAVITGSGQTITYTPDTNVCAPPTETFGYTISDGQGHTANASVTAVVTCVNDAPLANNDVFGTPEDTPITIPVLVNDVDPDGNTLTVTTVGSAAHGMTALQGSSARYVPALDYCGPDSFTYTASDGTLVAQGTVAISVTCVGESPRMAADNASTLEDTGITVTVLANDSDPDGGTLTVTSVGDPPHGTAAIAVGGTDVRYTPDANFCGSDMFTYAASNVTGPATASVSMTVTCVNDPPKVGADAATTDEDVSVHVHVLSNDVDPDGDTLTVKTVTAPDHGTTSIDSLRSVLYTPEPNFCGNDAYSYTVSDGTAPPVTGHVTVVVTCVNDAPTILPEANHTTVWGDQVVALLSAGDPDPTDILIYSLVSGPDGAVITAAGAFSWTPTSAQIGAFAVEAGVSDGSETSTTAFSVTVSRRATSLVYTGATSGQYSDAATVQATLTDTALGIGLSGRSVTFAVGGVPGAATTAASGLAVTAVQLILAMGPTSVSTAFPGDGAYLPASSSTAFTVAKESITAALTGPYLALATTSAVTVSLSASVVEEADGFLGSGLSGVTVSFKDAASGALLCSAPVIVTTPGRGAGTCTTAALPLSSRAVVVSAFGAAYAGPVDVAVVTVANPSRGDSAGAGRVGTERFGFQAKAKRKMAPAGDVVDVFTSGGTAIIVRSNTLTSLSVSCASGTPKTCSTVIQAASGSTLSVDLATGAVTPIAGTSALRLDATDVAEPASGSVPQDRIAIAITGTSAHTVGAPGSQLVITAGNIRVPS